VKFIIASLIDIYLMKKPDLSRGCGLALVDKGRRKRESCLANNARLRHSPSSCHYVQVSTCALRMHQSSAAGKPQETGQRSLPSLTSIEVNPGLQRPLS
jgi:hypothetical protein